MGARRGIRRWTWLALRVLLVFLAVQLAGVTHAIEDIAEDYVAVEAPDECPCEPTDCPPGCPACHAHATPTLLPARAAVLALVPLSEVVVPRLAWSDHAPSPPDASGLFRPPQHDA